MKVYLFRTFALVIFATAAAQAQSAQTMKADIPFAFTAGQRTLPPGVYTVTVVPSAVIVKSADHKGGVIVMTDSADSTGASSSVAALVFTRYEGQYFLSRVWSPAGDGRVLFRTQRERELAAKAASSSSETIFAKR